MAQVKMFCNIAGVKNDGITKFTIDSQIKWFQFNLADHQLKLWNGIALCSGGATAVLQAPPAQLRECILIENRERRGLANKNLHLYELHQQMMDHISCNLIKKSFKLLYKRLKTDIKLRLLKVLNFTKTGFWYQLLVTDTFFHQNPFKHQLITCKFCNFLIKFWYSW